MRWSPSVRAAYPRLSHRYYALKAKLVRARTARRIGTATRRCRWSRPAPIAWTEARDTVLTRLSRLLARDGGDRRALLRPSAGSMRRCGPARRPAPSRIRPSPSAHPYVLLNYQGKTRDVMTLAHELGHGVHQVLAAPQGALMAPTPLTLAETASVFGEMLTFQRAAGARPPIPCSARRCWPRKVEDMINTVVRQIAFYSFERKVHTERRERRTDRRPLRRDLDGACSAKASAPPIRPRARATRVFWTYIPHFIHSPFYVYAYAFGDCLVNSALCRLSRGPERRLPGPLRCAAPRPAAASIIPSCWRRSASTPRPANSGEGALRAAEGFIAELEKMEG